MHYRVLICCLCLLILTGCLPHSIGSKNVTLSPSYTGKTLKTGKAVYIAVQEPADPSLSETPAYIAIQFAKFIAPVARSVIPAGTATKQDVAGKAQNAKADYAMLVHVQQWKQGSMFSPSQSAAVTVTVFDAATEEILTESTIEATCHMMLAGLEQSPRECIRPQVELWLNNTFSAPAAISPYTDSSTFPKHHPK